MAARAAPGPCSRPWPPATRLLGRQLRRGPSPPLPKAAWAQVMGSSHRRLRGSRRSASRLAQRASPVGAVALLGSAVVVAAGAALFFLSRQEEPASSKKAPQTRSKSKDKVDREEVANILDAEIRAGDRIC
ncbi:hypothetical protein AK812_SmicGene18730 [Symbiodinium microadriaticum]|uniref:Uncharacterized protein n=1 Tax=Symbiodinium microadriaticum TaxID=2951 RepID=A0A1Q9DUE5_SYMMI|nr:hypothetical protein AK812_SmicGene18730 [Symbiodinium microadriaticum]